MKGYKYIFSILLVPFVFYGTWAANAVQSGRVTPYRDSANSNQTTSRTTNTTNRSMAISRTQSTPTTRNTNINRSATTLRGATARSNNVSPSTITRTATTKTNTARLATNATAVAEVLSKNYSNCRTVFNACMDEFCANKDAQLHRCACSSRLHEFDDIKKQLGAAEEKLLDFSQRLLTVNLDKEDALAINTATEGEIAFNTTEDKTASKRALDAIAKKLNANFQNTDFGNSVNSLTWSLNADTAFDSVDSLAGASTTTKTGTALYAAALPICRQMATEVCSESELSIAENGYNMLIEQDCNTVKKTYETQIEQTRAKILESSALLDMSRLDIYQTRNSDDVLTCKAKMLDMLTASNVCGADLGKCLDTTGQYIDPSTGEAFLTDQLVNLPNLITVPAEGQKWSDVNDQFVAFLNSKKKYIEPATQNCQNITNDVWNLFIEDAIAQIKLAQQAKLETVRQSCTTLTSQCLSNAIDSIEDFDSRALSIFGVSAIKTAQAMCNNIVESCNAILRTPGDTETQCQTGVSNIMLTEAYNNILSTCREVGRQCIIQQCSSIEGNFGLCTDTEYSINRKSILNRYSCWNEVYNCVASAGDTTLKSIANNLASEIGYDTTDKNFYTKLYDLSPGKPQPGDTICSGPDANLFTCKLTERIWGNCEHNPTDTAESNKIIQPRTGETTLLYWFAEQTYTTEANNACTDNTCLPGFTATINADGTVTCK
ncbi:MAG: hypothetical protein MJ170_01420 [Alphaproteobacteria bacterium]|nr:hypothetical protein [Alphaproteobacteria bacterium]